jgi:hypothetical protein
VSQQVLSPWGEYVERFRRGEWRDRIFHDMVLGDVRGRPRPRTVLDIGCGRGFDGNQEFQGSIARAADRYVGVEPDQRAIRLGKPGVLLAVRAVK